MKLSIIVPAHNEQENIAEVINKIEESLDIEHGLIVVNDNSTDGTVEIVERLSRQYDNIRLVHNKLENGFANALKTGFSNANTDIVIPIMADLCDDITTIPMILVKIKDGYDVVCGCRYAKGGARLGGSKLKGFLSGLGGLSIHYLLGIPTHDVANAFKMYRKKVIDSIDIKATGFEISMEITLKAYYSGFKITEVPTVWRERTRGKSSFKVLKLLPDYLKLYMWAIYKRLI
jgi:glycosyltransferase involved in cell wall biosynthesis